MCNAAEPSVMSAWAQDDAYVQHIAMLQGMLRSGLDGRHKGAIMKA